MTPRAGITKNLLLVLLLFAIGGVAQAEVAHLDGTLTMAGVTEDTDPIGMFFKRFSDRDANELLNEEGYHRGDRRPDLFWRDDGTPVATWSLLRGAIRFEVAFSEWTPAGWSEPEKVAKGFTDKLDPRVFVGPDGTAHVVWWEPGSRDRVFISHRETGTDDENPWTNPEEITSPTESGRRPSLLVVGEPVWVGFERDSPLAAQELVIKRGPVDGAYIEDFVLPTERSESLDLILHHQNGHLWVDWKLDSEFMAAAELVLGAWNVSHIIPWEDDTWVGVESTRRAIRRLVVNGF